MSGRGIGFLLLTCLFWVGTFATGAAEFLTAAALSTALLLISLATAVAARPSCRLETDERAAPRLIKRKVRVVLENSGFLPALRCGVNISLTRDGEPNVRLEKHLCDIPAKKRRSYETEVVCPHTGEYTVRADKFTSGDLFGFFRIKRRTRVTLGILSLPRLYKGRSLSELSAEGAETVEKRLGQEGEVQPESRAYQAGDSMRQVNWKQSVRRRKLLTRVRERNAEPEYLLLVNTAPPAGEKPPAEYIDAVCECALSLIYSALSARRSVITLMPCGVSNAAPETLRLFRHALAELRFKGSSDEAVLSGLLRKRDFPDVMFYVSGTADGVQDIQGFFEQLQRRGSKIIRLCPETLFNEEMKLSGFEPIAPDGAPLDETSKTT